MNKNTINAERMEREHDMDYYVFIVTKEFVMPLPLNWVDQDALMTVKAYLKAARTTDGMATTLRPDGKNMTRQHIVELPHLRTKLTDALIACETRFKLYQGWLAAIEEANAPKPQVTRKVRAHRTPSEGWGRPVHTVNADKLLANMEAKNKQDTSMRGAGGRTKNPSGKKGGDKKG